ncbi:hypothetical protein ACWOAQ_06915 [Helcococcus kunzii]|uniref:Uncharacterized protein n=1 Tax=Helcococcus kunzii ATCC 51366 TaxID=883114 RepID=H3NM63_9FIRM|nr:hypothetical protein [Helcococcus kunzii]EHR35472.1 hypothetical protein HMPREF9709_00424 [Helcococcus kunzii ATCC 51366]MCT1796134.1 hypothetical protein [Helcococcus kunzii]QUY64378.1 hypothetical protein GUI37_02135 [Helcococcus kunzii]QZO76792.1 hypothetical protein HIF96_01820 [Helcococcus kunzii]
MISILFKKIIKNEKGGAEFVESSFVFPTIQIFILLLIVLSLNTIEKIYTFEKVYKESRDEFYSKHKKTISTSEDLFEQYKNSSDVKVKDRKFNLDKKNSLFNTMVHSYEKDKMYLSTNKMDTDDIIRKLDFMKEVYLDIKDLDSFKKLGNFTTTINNMKDNLMKKLKK